MNNSETDDETFGGREREFLTLIQSRITALERELDDLRRSFASFMLDMGTEHVREYEGEELRLVKDAIIRVLARSSEPLTIGQIHEQFDGTCRVYGVTRRELHRVLSRLTQGKRSKIRRFRKGSPGRVVLYELRGQPKGLWHEGRYWNAAELGRDPLLNKLGLSERTIRDRLKGAESIHQVLAYPALGRGEGARQDGTSKEGVVVVEPPVA